MASREGISPPAGWVVASLGLATLMASLDTSIAIVALPTISSAFDAPFAQVQWVTLAYLLSLTAVIICAGRLGDLVGHQPLLVAGLTLFAGASLLCSLAPSLPILIASRALQGVGAAAMLAMAMALIGQALPPARAGRAMGVLGTMSALGTSLGPSLGGLLIDTVSWRALFLLNVPLGALTVGMVIWTLPRTFRFKRAHARFDWLGALLLIGTLTAYALAMTGRQLVLLLVSALIAGVFVQVERQVTSPLIRLSILRDRPLSAGLASSLLVTTIMMATLVIGPFYLGRALRLSASQVGLVLAAGPLAAAAMGVVAGLIVDRLGSRRVVLAALAGMTAGLAMLANAPDAASYVGSMIVVTTGYALFQTANNSAVMARAQADNRGVVAAMLSLSRNLGLISGAAAMGALFAIAVGADDVATAPPAAIAAGMRVAIAVAATLGMAAFAIAFGVRSPAPQFDD